MLKRFLYTISTLALAGGMAAATPAAADSIVRYSHPDVSAPAVEANPAERYVYYDPELNCWLAEPPLVQGGDNPEPDEPQPRFDSSKECVAYGRNPEIARDYDLEEPQPLPEGG